MSPGRRTSLHVLWLDWGLPLKVDVSANELWIYPHLNTLSFLPPEFCFLSLLIRRPLTVILFQLINLILCVLHSNHLKLLQSLLFGFDEFEEFFLFLLDLFLKLFLLVLLGLVVADTHKLLITILAEDFDFTIKHMFLWALWCLLDYDERWSRRPLFHFLYIF